MRRSAIICASGWLLVLAAGCEVTIKPWDLLFQQQQYTYFEVTTPPDQVLQAALGLCKSQKVACTVDHRTIDNVEVTKVRGASPEGKSFVLLIKPGQQGDRTLLRVLWTEGVDSAFETTLLQAVQRSAAPRSAGKPGAETVKRSARVSGLEVTAAKPKKQPASASWNDRADDEVLRVDAGK